MGNPSSAYSMAGAATCPNDIVPYFSSASSRPSTKPGVRAARGPMAGIGATLAGCSHCSGARCSKNWTVALEPATPTPLMAITGLSFILIRIGISPPRPTRLCSVTVAASTVATPASTALPPCASMRIPAATSRLLAAPTISWSPRTGGNMVRTVSWERAIIAEKSRSKHAGQRIGLCSHVLQRKAGGAKQARVAAQFSRLDARGRGLERTSIGEAAALDLGQHGRGEEFPRRHHSAAQQIQREIENVDQAGQRDPQRLAHHAENLARAIAGLAVLLGQLEDLLRRQIVAQTQEARHGGNGRRRSVFFDATAVAAAARIPVRGNGHVPDLAGHADLAVENAPVHDNSSADASAER